MEVTYKHEVQRAGRKKQASNRETGSTTPKQKCNEDEVTENKGTGMNRGDANEASETDQGNQNRRENTQRQNVKNKRLHTRRWTAK